MNYEEALKYADLGYKVSYEGFDGHVTGTGLNGGKNEYVHKATNDGEYEDYKPKADDKKAVWFTV